MLSPKERKEVEVLTRLVAGFRKTGEWLKDTQIKDGNPSLRFALDDLKSSGHVDARNLGICHVTPLGLFRLYDTKDVQALCKDADLLLAAMYEGYFRSADGQTNGKEIDIKDLSIADGSHLIGVGSLLEYLNAQRAISFSGGTRKATKVTVSSDTLNLLPMRYQLWLAAIESSQAAAVPQVRDLLRAAIFQFLLREWNEEWAILRSGTIQTHQDLVAMCVRLECLVQSTESFWRNSVEAESISRGLSNSRKLLGKATEGTDWTTQICQHLDSLTVVFQDSLMWALAQSTNGMSSKNRSLSALSAIGAFTALPRNLGFPIADLKLYLAGEADTGAWVEWAIRNDLVKKAKSLGSDEADLLAVSPKCDDLLRGRIVEQDGFFLLTKPPLPTKATHHKSPPEHRGWKAMWQPDKSVRLRQGGQSITFAVRKNGEKGGRLYVLKALRNPDRLARFKREVEALKSLNHENLLKLVHFDIQPGEDEPYIVTEYCPEGSLCDFPVRQLTEDELIRIFLQICKGVGAAHSVGIVHRDIKPANIFMRDRWTPVVGDLGICWIPEEAERPTETLEAVGPRLFMAPEFEGGKVKNVLPSADVYSLGKLLHWLFKQKPVPREHHHDPDFDIAEGRSGNAALQLVNQLLDRMIVEAPLRRLQDANEVVVEVERLIERHRAGGHALGPGIPQRCSYCAEGTYQVVVEAQRSPGGMGAPFAALNEFGFHPNPDGIWRILACDKCGHVQVFRTDLATSRGDSKANPY